ncbi:MAG TPA: (d)CMP kinase [Candidatus Saccharimonadia bacterium]
MTHEPNPNAVDLVNNRIVAIDGGTGTGKSRLGDELAQLLRRKGVPALFISTGYLYRAVTWVVLQEALARLPKRLAANERLAAAVRAVRAMDEPTMVAASERHQIAMHRGQVWIDEAVASVDEQLKGPGVGVAIPHVASFLGVRQMVNAAARRQVNEFDGFVIVEGRDIGHSVLPEAPLRILLTVAPEVAAERSKEHSVAEVIARDEADRAHKYGALKHPDDARAYTHVFSTDAHTPESARDHTFSLMQATFPTLV